MSIVFEQKTPRIVWLLLSFFLAMSWLLPNHTKPWTTFHSELWFSLVFSIVCLVVFGRARGAVAVSGSVLFFFCLSFIPWLQFTGGVIYSFGTAWVNCIYLLGFSIAIFLGWNWEKQEPGAALDFLFGSIIFAGLVSVTLQTCQILRVDGLGIWLNSTPNSRFSGNLGQPNLMATLLLLGVCGSVWGYTRAWFKGVHCLLMVAMLLWGVALTESRTGWLNVSVMVAGFIFLWGDKKPKSFNAIVLVLGVYFVLLCLMVPEINAWISGETVFRRTVSDPIRLVIWGRAFDLILDKPFTGYGWGEIREAYIGLTDLPNLHGPLSHSHNIFLDILLCNGIVLGGLIITYVLTLINRLRTVARSDYSVIPALGCLLVFIHAMLELPLHYAHFLLPFGIIFGVLLKRSCVPPVFHLKQSIVLIFLGASACLLVLTGFDCFEVERTISFINYGRKEKLSESEYVPKLLVLTQWRDRLEFANSSPDKVISEEQYLHLKGVVITTPSPFLFFRFAQSLALNGMEVRAKIWLNSMCNTSPPQFLKDFEKHWQELSQENEKYRAVMWSGCRDAAMVK